MKAFIRPFAIVLAIFFSHHLTAGPGDTIVVQTIDFNTPVNPGWNAPREGKYLFPPDSISFSKILMYYTLKCDPSQNPACGEWDYTTHTYLHYHTGEYDSNLYSHPNFIVNGATPDTFAYMDQTSWRYTPRKEYSNLTSPLNTATLGNGLAMDYLAYPDAPDGRSYYLFTQAELQTNGLASGDITGLQVNTVDFDVSVQHLKIRLKGTTETTLNPDAIVEEGFVEVYGKNTSFPAVGWQSLPFSYPFDWDGTSNLVVEISYAGQSTPDGITVTADPSDPGQAVSSHMPDYCLDFEGTDFVDVPAGSLATLDSSITICFWQYGDPVKQPQNDAILGGIDDDGNRVLNVHLPWSNGRVYWDAGFEEGYDRLHVLCPNPSYYEGKWNHWAFTKDCRNGEMKIYYNGQMISYAWGKYKPMDGITSFTIGAYPDRSNYYDGMIDEFQVWDTELSDTLINAWMTKSIDPSHPEYGHLLAYFPFDEGEGLITASAAPSGGPADLGGYPNWLSYKGQNRFKHFTEEDQRLQVRFEQGSYDPAGLDSLIVTDSLAMGQLMIVMFSDSLNPLIPTDTLSKWPEYYHQYVYDEDGNATDSTYVTPDAYLYRQDWPYYGTPFEITIPYELGRFITPYGNGLDLGEGFTWVYDVTDFRPLLKDSVHLTAGNFQELLDLDFHMIEGTPPRDVQRIDRLWRGNFRLNSFEDTVLPDTLALSDTASSVKLKITTSGHEWDNATNCAEFCQKTHWVELDETTIHTWQILDKCSTNPLYPQGGTWTYDRAGWCPGAKVTERHIELTPYISSDSIIIDYNCQSDPYGLYIVSSYLFSYGVPNYNLDAEIEEVLAPNDEKFYGRIFPDSPGPLFNPICGQPVVRIRNSGADTLTSVTISYGPQTGIQQEFQWTGSLAFMESEEVVLDPIDWTGYDPGNSNFLVHLSQPNGDTDENPWNDEMKTTFSLVDELPNEFQVILKTNHRGYENRWEIIDDSGNIVMERDDFENDVTYVDTVLLDDGCYTFRITDTGDDGLSHWASSQGSGYIQFKDMDGANLYYPNQDFGYFTAKSFTVGLAVETQELVKKDHISVFPNPSNGKVNIAFTMLQEENVRLTLTTLYGQEIREMEKYVDNELVTWDLEDLSAGIYLLIIQYRDETFTRKIILQ